MNLIDKQFEKIKREKRIGLMTHVVAGYPDLETTEIVVKAMAKAGADFVEIQIPFSDPLADGPTIMKASEEALRRGVRVRDSFDLMGKLSKEVEIPLLFMSYFNIVFKYGLPAGRQGVEKFCEDAKAAGASGLIVPDMPLEEEKEEHFIENAEKNGLYAIRVISPASTEERLKKNAAAAKGFVYCMARQGITGAKKDLDRELVSYLERVKKFFDDPLAVGFGISKREHVEALKGHADVAIVGSAVIDVISKSEKGEIEKNVGEFVSLLAKAE